MSDRRSTDTSGIGEQPRDDGPGAGAESALRGGVVDLRALVRIARTERVTVLAIVVAFLALSVVYLHLADEQYAVRVVITAASSNQAPRGGALSELSSLAGIDVSNSNGSQFRLFVAALNSPFAAQAIAADQDLLKAMFPRDWSATERRWRQPPSHIRPVIRPVMRWLGWYSRPWSPPGESRVFDYLKAQLRIIPDTRSGAVGLEIDSSRPEVAERILTTLINAVDERMRQHDLARATTDIDYLEQRLSTTSVDEYRRALVTNLVDQEKMRMLASAPLPYVTDVFGRPMISASPVAPTPLAVFAIALILGGLVGVGVACFKHNRQ